MPLKDNSFKGFWKWKIRRNIMRPLKTKKVRIRNKDGKNTKSLRTSLKNKKVKDFSNRQTLALT